MDKRRLEIYKTVLMKDTKVIASQVVVTLLMLFFPMVLGIIYGLMYQNVLDQNITWSPLVVYILDETEESDWRFVENILRTEHLPFVTVIQTESESFLEKSLTEQDNSVGIRIRREGEKMNLHWFNPRGQSLEKNLVYQSLEKGIKEYQWQILVEETLGAYSIGFQKELAQFSSKLLIKESVTQESRILTTNEYYLISLFVAFGFLLSTEFLRDREQKLIARAFTAGVSKSALYFSNFVSNFVIVLGLVFVYFSIVFGIVLRPSIGFFQFVLVALLQALAISSYQSLISGVFKTNKTGLALGMPLLFVMLYLGGSFYPVDQSPTLRAIANGTPNFQLFKLYESLVIGTPFQEPWRIFILLGVCAILTLTGWFVFLKEEVV